MSIDVSPLVEMFRDSEAKVKALDEVLDAATDQKSAGRRAVINSLVANNEDEVNSIVEQFKAALAGSPPEHAFGVYFGVLRGLRNEFDENGVAYAESLVEQRPQVKVDPAEVERANADRSNKVEQLKHLRAILATSLSEEELEAFKVPRRRSMGGPRGKRAIGFYTWTVDGVPFEGNITELAKHLGYERPADLRDEMKVEVDGKPLINLTKPPDVINFTTSGGNVLVGTKSADAPNWEEVPDEDADDDDDVDENEESNVPVNV